MLELPHGNPDFADTHVMLVEHLGDGYFRASLLIGGHERQAVKVANGVLLTFAQLYKEEFFIGDIVNGFWFRLAVVDALELQEYVSERIPW